MSRRVLLNELTRPDGLGRHVHRLFLGRWELGPPRFEPDEFLGEFLADPGAPVGKSEWIGTHPDCLLRIALPNGRVVEVQGAVYTIARGFAATYLVLPGAKKARPKATKPVPPEAQSTLF
jgi:hypothetical protein